MPRVLLLLPTATYRAADFLAAARAIGAEVVVASERRQALAATMGPNFLTIRLDDPDAAAAAIVASARRTPLDAVVAVDDQGVLIAAKAAQRLGLAHNPPDAAATTRNKVRMRAAFARAGVPQPSFRVVHPDDDVVRAATEVGLPCVVKPVSLSASRGVIRADTQSAATAAAARVRRILDDAGEDPAGPLLVEGFVPGGEVTVEGLLRGGTFEALAVFDKPDPLDGPYFEETLFVTPSRLPRAVLEDVHAAAASAAAAVGLTEGPVHAEFRVNASGVWVLELAARSIGGLCSRALRFGLGITLEEVILRHALDMPLHDLSRARAASGVLMLPIPRAGVLEGVHGVEDARRVPGVLGVEITVAPGRTLVPLPEGDRYLGFVFAAGAEPESVEGVLRAAAARLDVVFDDSATSSPTRSTGSCRSRGR